MSASKKRRELNRARVECEAARIAALPPARQVMEIGRLAERIAVSSKNKTTKAQPPIKPTQITLSTTPTRIISC